MWRKSCFAGRFPDPKTASASPSSAPMTSSNLETDRFEGGARCCRLLGFPLGSNQIQGCFWEAVLGVMERLVLSEAAWARMAALIIGRPDQKGSTGRDNRMFVEGCCGSCVRVLPGAIFRRRLAIGTACSGASVDGASKGFGSGSSRRCPTIRDFEYLIVNSTIVRAHQRAAGAKRG